MNKELSKVITLLRFPLITSVVLIHSYSVTVGFKNNVIAGESGFSNLFIQNFVSQVVGRIAIPAFFLISGFLLYQGKPLTFDLVKKKWRSRVRSILVPYLIWNTIDLIIQSVGQLVPQTKRFFTGATFDIQSYSIYTVADAYLGFDIGPINYPLWFLRDLMILIVVSPLLYYLATRFGALVVLPCVFLWIGVFEELSVFVSREALVFFLVGLWLSRKTLDNGIRITLRLGNVLLYTYLSSAIVEAVVLTTSYDVCYLHQVNILLGILSMFVIFARLDKQSLASVVLTLLAPVSFFVYLAHGSVITAYKKLLYISVNPQSDPMFIMIYFGVPFLTICTLVFTYFTMAKYCPSMLSRLTARRLDSAQQDDALNDLQRRFRRCKS